MKYRHWYWQSVVNNPADNNNNISPHNKHEINCNNNKSFNKKNNSVSII